MFSLLGQYPILTDQSENNTIMEFYNNPKVKKALHVPKDSIDWIGCIPGAGRRRRLTGGDDNNEEGLLPGQILLAHDKPESMVPYVAELLDAGMKVLVYNGDRDLSVNAQGSEKLLDAMMWNGVEGWKKAKRSLWMVENNNTVAGYAKSYQNLDFIIVHDSGHLVPYNVPIPALDMITRFVNDESFHDIELPYFEPRGSKSSSTSSSSQCQEQMEHSNSTHSRHHILILCVMAVVCFGCGFLASSFFNGRRKGYNQIIDGNDDTFTENVGYQMQQSSANGNAPPGRFDML